MKRNEVLYQLTAIQLFICSCVYIKLQRGASVDSAMTESFIIGAVVYLLNLVFNLVACTASDSSNKTQPH
jgi:hypothetical protein